MARRHPCPSEEHGGAVGGSSTKMEQDVPELEENEARFIIDMLIYGELDLKIMEIWMLFKLPSCALPEPHL